MRRCFLLCVLIAVNIHGVVVATTLLCAVRLTFINLARLLNHLSHYTLSTTHGFSFASRLSSFWHNLTLLTFIRKEKSTVSRLHLYPVLRAHVLGTVPMKTGDVYLIKLITVGLIFASFLHDLTHP